MVQKAFQRDALHCRRTLEPALGQPMETRSIKFEFGQRLARSLPAEAKGEIGTGHPTTIDRVLAPAKAEAERAEASTQRDGEALIES